MTDFPELRYSARAGVLGAAPFAQIRALLSAYDQRGTEGFILAGKIVDFGAEIERLKAELADNAKVIAGLREQLSDKDGTLAHAEAFHGAMMDAEDIAHMVQAYGHRVTVSRLTSEAEERDAVMDETDTNYVREKEQRAALQVICDAQEKRIRELEAEQSANQGAVAHAEAFQRAAMDNLARAEAAETLVNSWAGRRFRDYQATISRLTSEAEEREKRIEMILAEGRVLNKGFTAAERAGREKAEPNPDADQFARELFHIGWMREQFLSLIAAGKSREEARLAVELTEAAMRGEALQGMFDRELKRGKDIHATLTARVGELEAKARERDEEQYHLLGAMSEPGTQNVALIRRAAELEALLEEQACQTEDGFKQRDNALENLTKITVQFRASKAQVAGLREAAVPFVRFAKTVLEADGISQLPGLVAERACHRITGDDFRALVAADAALNQKEA